MNGQIGKKDGEMGEAIDLLYDTISANYGLLNLYSEVRKKYGGFDENDFQRTVLEVVVLVAAKLRNDGCPPSANEVRHELYARLKIVASTCEKEPWQNKVLYDFSRFCGPANRENIQFMQRDFILEARDMRKAQHNKWFIATALTWRALFGGILPIMSDGVMRLIKPVKEAKDIAKKSGD